MYGSSVWNYQRHKAIWACFIRTNNPSSPVNTVEGILNITLMVSIQCILNNALHWLVVHFSTRLYIFPAHGFPDSCRVWVMETNLLPRNGQMWLAWGHIDIILATGYIWLAWPADQFHIWILINYSYPAQVNIKYSLVLYLLSSQLYK